MIDVILRILTALVLALGSPSPSVPPEPAAANWTATWCAPTPRYCHGWGGGAHLGAVHSFRFGDEPYWVRVSRTADGVVRTTTVLIVSFCGCGGHNVDLSPAAFRELAPTSLGRIRVSLERVDGVPTRLPATDTGG
jgi:hypothetical protein